MITPFGTPVLLAPPPPATSSKSGPTHWQANAGKGKRWERDWLLLLLLLPAAAAAPCFASPGMGTAGVFVGASTSCVYVPWGRVGEMMGGGWVGRAQINLQGSTQHKHKHACITAAAAPCKKKEAPLAFKVGPNTIWRLYYDSRRTKAGGPQLSSGPRVEDVLRPTQTILRHPNAHSTWPPHTSRECVHGGGESGWPYRVTLASLPPRSTPQPSIPAARGIGQAHHHA
jgi:hypothetical protein